MTKLLAERDAWLRDIDPTHHFHRLFDVLHGVLFFAKNTRGETMLVSRSILDRYGMSDETEMLGMTDFDLNPDHMASGYVADDAHIYRTGEPLLHRVELWFDEQGVPDWYIVHKLPIRSRAGEIIGIMGILQSYVGQEKLIPPFYEIAPLVDHIRKNFRDPLHVEDLARKASISVRQLERKFKAAFGISPHDFVCRTRIQAACRVLRESDMPLVDIAMDHGFCDQSAFAHHFKKYIGMTPSQFRRTSFKR
jgi:AraC-like DNA-binding protein